MVNPSNLYAERIYSEHPSAFWALDDNANYVKLMPEASLDLAGTYTFTTQYITNRQNITSFSAYQTPPITSSNTTEITLSNLDWVAGTPRTTTASMYTATGISFPTTTNAFTISFYYYSANPNITSITVGYKVGGVTQPGSKTYAISSANSWQHLTTAFNYSPGSAQAVQAFLEFNYSENQALLDDLDTYQILINGFSIGYASEEFNKQSVGISQSSLTQIDSLFPSGIFGSGTYGYLLDAYGTSDTSVNGWYVVGSNNKLSARNSGIPMIFGSTNSTIVYSAGGSPSIVVPAQGFLNKSGSNNEYTFEFWLRARVTANNSITRIFGPISSTDGLYVNKTSITLKIGNKKSSYYVGEWYRPMLLDIRYSSTQASLLINGETVITLSIESTDRATFPEKVVSSKNQDWVGFYVDATSSIASFELDGIAVYPYIVDNTLAKRRYVYGQGVEFPQNVNTAYHGKSFFIDYATANYANNYRYPAIKNWQTKTMDNFDISDGTLSSPSLTMPTMKFVDNTKTYSTWCSTLNSTNTGTNTYFTLSTSGHNGYILFDSVNLLNNSDTRAFSISVYPTAYVVGVNQTVAKFVNSNNGDYLMLVLVPTTTTSAVLKYKYKIGDDSEADLDTTNLEQVVSTGANFSTGIDFETLSQTYFDKIGSLLNNQSSLQLYVGNDENFATAFTGRVYDIGFASYLNFANNFGLAASIFNSFGILTNTGTGRSATSTKNTLVAYAHSYKLIVSKPLNGTSYELSLGAGSIWQDYVPLKTLSKYTSDGTTSTYELDFIQFNIDYPEPTVFASNSYTTTGSDVRTYVYFRYISSGSYVNTSSFTSVAMPQNGVVVPTSNWKTDRYEVVNGSVIYPPSNLDANTTINDLIMGVVIEAKNLTNQTSPVKIKSLQLASQALDNVTTQWSNGIGTKYGENVYPFTYTGSGSSKTFNYKNKNPYRIYKNSTPYLYLTRDSGIKVLSEYSAGAYTRGISVPINQALESDYNLSSLQMSFRYEGASFPTSETKIFSLEYIINPGVSQTIKVIDFYLIADGNTTIANRAKIYARDASDSSIYDNLVYYVNGNSVTSPTLNVGEWTNFAFALVPLLDFDAFIGDFRIVGPLTINNISYYKYTGLQTNTKYAEQQWSYYQHSQWSSYDTEKTWADILASEYDAVSGINPTEAYNAIIGTNKAIMDNTSDEATLRFYEKSKKVVGSVDWQSKTIKPV